MRRHYHILLTLSLALASCGEPDALEDTVLPQAAREVICFSATLDQGMTAEALTRASNQIADESGLRSRGFGVFASYTGLHKYSDSDVTVNFMYDQKVEYAGSAWTYSPKLYWPNGEGETGAPSATNPHYVSFFAYAPYSDGVSTAPATNPAGYCIHEFSSANVQGDPWLTYRLIDQENLGRQVDLLYAPPLSDRTKGTKDGSLKFHFSHALACVGDRVTVGLSDLMKNSLVTHIDHTSWESVTVNITSVALTYALTERARLVLWNQGTANWQTDLGEESVVTRTVSLTGKTISGKDYTLPYTVFTYDGTTRTDYPVWTETEGGVFYIPVEAGGVAQQATLTVDFDVVTVKGGETLTDHKTGNVTVNLADYPTAYQPGKHLYIGATLDWVAITLTATISEWVTEDRGEVIAEQ